LPDVVLLDVALPRDDGIKVAERMASLVSALSGWRQKKGKP
jgi:CheY-like chemotaxis protein